MHWNDEGDEDLQMALELVYEERQGPQEPPLVGVRRIMIRLERSSIIA
jgi:hypothetical protein